MLRLSVFLLLSLAVHAAASWLLHAPAIPPALAQASEVPQALRLAALQLLPAPQPPQPPQLQPQRPTMPVARAVKVLPAKPRAPKAAVSAPVAPVAATRVEPAAQTAASAPQRQIAQSAPPREVFSREPSFREPPRPPRYPAQARRRNQQGTVMVEVRLDGRGEQRGLSVLRSSGIDSLDRAALEAVAAWRFRPETAGGRTVPSRVQIPIRFALTASR